MKSDNNLQSDPTSDLLECESLGDALRDKRPLRPARSYGILVARDSLNFSAVQVTDPLPLGRQILASAGIDPRGDFSLFAILQNGDFEDVRSDEPFDLRGRGAERFVAFQTDRLFKLTLKGHELEWGKPAISGSILYGLAKIGGDEAVFLEVAGGTDKLIELSDLIDLRAPGVEHFIIGPKPVSTYEITVNSRPKIIDHQHVTFEEVVHLAFPGVHDPNIRFSMTFRHAESKPHAGELGPGGAVEVKPKGTIFNVTKTVQS